MSLRRNINNNNDDDDDDNINKYTLGKPQDNAPINTQYTCRAGKPCTLTLIQELCSTLWDFHARLQLSSLVQETPLVLPCFAGLVVPHFPWFVNGLEPDRLSVRRQ